MKNDVFTIILIIIIMVLSAFCLLYGVKNTILSSLQPLHAEVGVIRSSQIQMQRQIMALNDQNLANQWNSLNDKLTALDSKISKINLPRSDERKAAPSEDSNQVFTIKVGASPLLGHKNAPVTITGFFDIQCPFCDRFYPVVRDVMKAYPNQVNFVVKNYPLDFHPNALPAAKLALAANLQGKYYETLELLMQNGGAVTEDKIKSYADKAKLNYKKLMKDYKDKDAQWQKIIDEDKALAEQVQVNATPTFFINGRKTSARNVEAYKVQIDKILADKK